MVFASDADQIRPKQPRIKSFLSYIVQVRPKAGNVIGGKIGGKTLSKGSVIFYTLIGFPEAKKRDFVKHEARINPRGQAL